MINSSFFTLPDLDLVLCLGLGVFLLEVFPLAFLMVSLEEVLRAGETAAAEAEVGVAFSSPLLAVSELPELTPLEL